MQLHIIVFKNYVDILKEIVEVSSETGVKKAELLLEHDFKGSDSDNGIAPAFYCRDQTGGSSK